MSYFINGVIELVMIEAFVRPEKADDILAKLKDKGFAAATRMSVLGRGKQKGLKAVDVYYDELPKELLMLVVQDKQEQLAVDTILQSAKSKGDGAFGDGKIFVTPVSKAYTVSSGKAEL